MSLRKSGPFPGSALYRTSHTACANFQYDRVFDTRSCGGLLGVKPPSALLVRVPQTVAGAP